MPIIRTTLLEGFATPEQRSEIVTRLADTLVDIFGDVTKPYIFSIVEEVLPGAWSIGGNVANEEMIAFGVKTSGENLARKLTAERVGKAYGALASGDRVAIEDFWDTGLVWTVPGESRVSGVKKGLDDFLAFMKTVGELSGDSFSMEPKGVMVSDDQTVDISRNTATRPDHPDRRLDIDVVHVLRWSDGRIVEGRGAISGTGTSEFKDFWA